MRGAVLAALLSMQLISLPALRALGPAAPAIHSAGYGLTEALFVLLLGLTAGAVFGKTLRQQGLAACLGAMLRRAGGYYLTFTLSAVVVAVLRAVPALETATLSRWADPASGYLISLYPGVHDRMAYQLFELAFLRAGPRQLQILALCAALMAAAPLLLWTLSLRRGGLLLGASWALALATQGLPAPVGSERLAVLGLQFEQFYPLALWQLPFVHGLALGWSRARWLPWVGRHRLAVVAVGVAALLAGGTIFSAPPTAIVALLLGLALIVTGHTALSRCWAPLRGGLGWLLLPLGQFPLGVFGLHALWLLLWSQAPVLSAPAAMLALAASGCATWLAINGRYLAAGLTHHLAHWRRSRRDAQE